MTAEQSSTSVQEPQDLSQIIKIDEAKVSSHLGDLVRRTVEETLNGMLDAEAQEMCQAGRYERSEARQNSRAGFYQRKLQTQAGEVKLNVPKLRQAKFESVRPANPVPSAGVLGISFEGDAWLIRGQN